MAKKVSFFQVKSLKRIIKFVFISIVFCVVGFFSLIFVAFFIFSILNYRQNPCTKIPILSSLGIIKECSITLGCRYNSDCHIDFAKTDGKCRLFAVNSVARRCQNADDLWRFKPKNEIEVEAYRRLGITTDKQACENMMRTWNNSGYIGSQYYGWIASCGTDPFPTEKANAYCKKTDFDEHFNGQGICTLK